MESLSLETEQTPLELRIHNRKYVYTHAPKYIVKWILLTHFNKLRPEQNDRHFADDICKLCILIKTHCNRHK